MNSFFQRARKFLGNISIRSKFIFSLLFFVILFLIMMQRVSTFQEKKVTELFTNSILEKEKTFDMLFNQKARHLEILVYHEYGQWDEMIDFIYDFDPEFAKLNLDWLIADYDFNSLWIYDTLYQQVYFSTDSLFMKPIANEKLFSELSGGNRELRFYEYIDNNFIEFIATSIYPSEYAPGQQPCYGYIITAQVIDENYIHQLEELFESSITLTETHTEIEDTQNFSVIEFSKPMLSYDNSTIGYLNVKLGSHIIGEAISSSKTLLFVFSHVTLFILFIFVLLFVKYVSLPLKKITSSLDNQSDKMLSSMLTKNDEFGKISNLISQFFAQKSELEEQIKQREIAETNLQSLNKLLKERVSIRTAELKALIEQAPFAIGIFDKRGVLIESNLVYQKHFAFMEKPEYNLNEIIEIVFSGDSEYKSKLNDIFVTGGEFYTYPLLMEPNANNGSDAENSQWLIFRFFSIKPEDSNDIRIVNIIEDITKNKKMEEAQKRITENELVSLAIYNAQEEERKRVSAELHDSIGQKLSAIQMKIELYSKKYSANNSHLDDIKQTLFQTGKELRNIIKDLHPNDLDDYGLIKSLDLLCKEIGNMTAINVYFNEYNYPAITDPVVELNIYRIVQEALNNIAKHSQATEASVQIYYRDKFILVNIEDNGKGINFEIDKKTEDSKMGFGLLNMKRRTETLKGNFYIDSSESLGTEIHIKIPWG